MDIADQTIRRCAIHACWLYYWVASLILVMLEFPLSWGDAYAQSAYYTVYNICDTNNLFLLCFSMNKRYCVGCLHAANKLLCAMTLVYFYQGSRVLKGGVRTGKLPGHSYSQSTYEPHSKCYLHSSDRHGYWDCLDSQRNYAHCKL